eukprot:TRINITY_DN47502_c0_g1_i1.p2 TRINITY_DN47502_c0_g1~~TRINITY_DN47502_c0_g1_i1.p2  ORF type:complete len:522 (+),score=161.97 TRINITY_DN47502_c0_g1_i1:46-1611(+)
MSAAAAAADNGDSDASALSRAVFTVAVACTLGAYWVHKCKKSPTDATKLLEELWGLPFRPLTERQRSLVLLFSALGLLALCLFAALHLGVGALVIVVGLVNIVLRQYGIVQVFGLRLRQAVRHSLGLSCQASSASAAGGSSAAAGAPQAPLPVWVLTGFLGSGKTTLANRLVASRRLRLLCITNEAGETALDAELIIQAAGSAENVLLVNDGCACCKVRGDLCDMLRDEVLGCSARHRAEGVVIECSGLADPRAVALTFLLDEDLRKRLELREVIAVADAANLGRHLRRRRGAAAPALTKLVEEQIAFASLVLLNKAECADASELEALRSELAVINGTAEVLSCSYCDVDVARVLRASTSASASSAYRNGAWSPDRALVEIESVKLALSGGSSGGSPAGAPREASSAAAAAGREEEAAEDDDGAVRCVSIRLEGELDLDAFNRWVLRTLKDFQILRAKGVLAARGHEEKLAFQAVHAFFHGTPSLSSRWAPREPRFSQIVVIGCGIDPTLLEHGLRRCLLS